MTQDVIRYADIWTGHWILQHPVRCLGIILHLVLRILFDILKQIDLDRLTEMPQDSARERHSQTTAP